MLTKGHMCRTEHATHKERSRHKTCGTAVSPMRDLMTYQERASTVMKSEESQECLPTGGKSRRKIIKYRKNFWMVSEVVAV